MQVQDTRTEILIVGGGLAGLSAACYLARAGRSVTLYEKASELGGRASTRLQDGYMFNRGGHGFYRGGAATEVLSELGIPYSGKSPTEAFALQGEKILTYPTGLLTLFTSNLLSVSEKQELARLFTRVPGLKPASFRDMSVTQWLEHTIKRPHLRQVMAAAARTFTYSAALDKISVEVFLTQAQLALKQPVFYINGGWQTLVEGLRRTAERSGARIVSGARVKTVLHQSGAVKGLELATGEKVSADTVVVAASPGEVSQLVDEGSHPYLRRLAEHLRPVEVACLDVALRHLPPERHYRAVFDLARPRFLAFQSLTVPIAPPDGALIHTFQYLDDASPTDVRQDERDLENLLDSVQPGWRAEEVRRFFLPRMTALNMLVTAADGGLRGRPGYAVEGLAGLYLAGDWIGSEGYLVDASLASARHVARMVLQRESIVQRDLSPAFL